MDVDEKQSAKRKKSDHPALPKYIAEGFFAPQNKKRKGSKGGAVVLDKQGQKELAKQRKSEKPHAEAVLQVNEVLNQVAFKRLSKEEVRAKIDMIMKLTKDIRFAVCCKHDTSRVMQKVVKFGSPAQLYDLHESLKGNYVQMAMDKYGHFLIIKIVNFGNDTQRKGIIEELLSHCVKLSSHAEGAKVLDYVYANSTQLEQALIIADFLKGQYALEHKLGQAPTPLATRLEKADPAERTAILTTIRTYLLKMAHKQMLMFRFVHSMAKQWLLFADDAMEDDLVTDLGASALAMHDSREGADVVCHLIRYGSTKQRKVMIKLFKPRALEFWLHDHAHRIVMCALRTVDDTVLLAKNLITPIMETDAQGNACVHHDVCTSVGASKIFIGVISTGEGELKRYFKEADVKNVLAIASGDHTKKDPAQRRVELLNVLLLPMLRTLAQKARWLTGRYTDEGEAVQVKGEGMDVSNLCGVLCDKSGGKIVLEGLRIAAELAGQLKETEAVKAAADDVYAALAELCGADVFANFKVLEHYQAHYVYKWLLTRLPAQEGTSFAQQLFAAVEPVLTETAGSGRAAFVLLSLLENCSDAALVKQVAEALGSAYGEGLPKDARQGSKLLAAKVNELLTGKKSKSKTKAERKYGNDNSSSRSKNYSISLGKKTRRSKR